MWDALWGDSEGLGEPTASAAGAPLAASAPSAAKSQHRGECWGAERLSCQLPASYPYGFYIASCHTESRPANIQHISQLDLLYKIVDG